MKNDINRRQFIGRPEAAVQAGHPYTPNCNGPTQIGVGFCDLNTRDGLRLSTAVAFRRPALERPNLTLITNARVHKIEIDNGRATGVTYMQNGVVHTVNATGEVIVSGGTIESPRILMLSGIGPRAQLEKISVVVKHDLPGVGQNLHDHTLLPVTWEASKPVPPPNTMGVTPLHVQLFAKSCPSGLSPICSPWDCRALLRARAGWLRHQCLHLQRRRREADVPWRDTTDVGGSRSGHRTGRQCVGHRLRRRNIGDLYQVAARGR